MLIDTGAALTIINSQLFYQLPYSIRQNARNLTMKFQVHLADKSSLYVQKSLPLQITIADRTMEHIVYVVPQLWRPCIIGNDFIRKHNLHIDGGRQQVSFQETIPLHSEIQNQKVVNTTHDQYILSSTECVKIPPYHAIYIQVQPNKEIPIIENDDVDYEVNTIKHTPCVANGIIKIQQPMYLQVANLSRHQAIIQPGQALASIAPLNSLQASMINQVEKMEQPISSDRHPSLKNVDLTESTLTHSQKITLENVIKSFSDVFSEKSGKTKVLQHHIKLTSGSKPYNSPPYRYSPEKRHIIETNLDDMKEQGIIEPSKSPWASPVVLAPKKDGSIRFCVDYRKLNTMTIRDAYPIPRIDDTLDALQEAKFVTTLDLRSGYWQVEMDKASKEKTAFITHKGLYEFNVMPYGLTNAPATFQRLMDVVLAGLKWQCCLVYIDDIVIYSPNFEQHLVDLKKVLQALRDANLTLKTSKCCFCRKEMKYLGHIITPDGIKPDPSLTKAITNFPQPKTIKDVQSFLGLSGYYRRFIKDYAKIAEPLLKQLRQLKEKHYHLTWTSDCTLAFENLKKKLTSAPIMSTPNFNEAFILELDACEYGLGAVLAQEYDQKKLVIAYASRTLSPAERNYSATEREALAIVWATQHFRPYLEGTKVFIRSDCKALQWLKDAKDISGRLARWAMKLSAFQIESIQYRPGAANANADSLSRNPLAAMKEKSIEAFTPTVDEPETKPGHNNNSSNMENGVHEIAAIETMLSIWQNTNILDDIKIEQQQDTKLASIIQQLKSNPSPGNSDQKYPFVLINDILYKIKNSNRHYNQRMLGNKHLLVIPKSSQTKLLQWAHNHPTGGHAGQHKTLFRLSSRVYWASMRKDIFNYVAACAECQKFKYNNLPMAAPMRLHEVLEPWHTVGIDLMGPFPATSRQKRFLLVVVDYFTRWVEAFPMRTTTSSNVADILINEVFARYGLPKYILSDNGPQFVSNLFQDFCRSMNIKRKFTANYHPQTNMSERVNRTLKPLIAIFSREHPHSWDNKIPQLLFAIRTSVNETTGETPAFLMFGRDPRIPLDLLVGDPVQPLMPISVDREQLENYRHQLMYNLHVAFTMAREHSDVEKLSQKMKYDQHTTQREFKIGDLVWVAIPAAQIGDTSIRHKLYPRYQGPCRIMEQLNPSTFIVKRISDDVNLGATNVDRLKLYYQPILDPVTDTGSTINQSLRRSDQTHTNRGSQTTPSTTQMNPPSLQVPLQTSNPPYNQSTINTQVPRRLRSSRQHRPPIRFSS